MPSRSTGCRRSGLGTLAPATASVALGSAKVVLATAASSDAMSATIDGLRHNGELIVLGATPESIQVSPFQLIAASRSVHGHPSGTARDVEELLRFAALTGVQPVIETSPLDEVEAAYDRMLSGDARALLGKIGLSRTRSSTTVSPPSGVRNRSARPSANSSPRSRQNPSYPEVLGPAL
ncbi:hypothetical protein [Nonomuraea sp. NPDC049784]|uniref:hypothetical protein n=1 Tax=Nonomuraea sp. NPDC049784 TaxID=3154361 RepID=UPI0034019498